MPEVSWDGKVCGSMEEPQRASLASQYLAPSRWMQCLTRSPEHQSGCVPSDSPQMLYGSLWICFRSLAQKPAQPFLHHVVWIMQELDGESYDFWEKHFLPDRKSVVYGNSVYYCGLYITS